AEPGSETPQISYRSRIQPASAQAERGDRWTPGRAEPMMASVPRGYAAYVLAVMVGINFLNFVDRWVGSAVAPLIQREFRLSDFEVGILGTAFLLVYAVAALPFGYWADRG